MYKSHLTPISFTLLLWLSLPCHCQYDPYGGSPYYGEPQPYYDPYFRPPEGFPQAQPPQEQTYPPLASNSNNANLFTNNPFLPTGQQSQSQNQLSQQQLLQQKLQQLQGSYPNLPSVPFQTVTPNNNPNQRVDKYPFPPTQTLGNAGHPNPNNNNNNFNSLTNLQQQQTFGNSLLNQHYPQFPDHPFQTVHPSQQNPSIAPYINGNPYKPKIELPKIRVIEFPSSEYFEYGGGKLVQPKRPNADLYVGGSGGDVPITSKVFIECTGPNQVEWVFNGTNGQKNDLSVVTKNFQITIPEERGPEPGSREYTYLRLGLEEQISEKDSGVYLCRDRILPQNYISIRVLVPKLPTGKPNYPFVRPRDPNTIYYSRRDPSVVLPCKIENAEATISLHKHDGGKLSCPYTVGDGRVSYDRFKGFIMQIQAFRDIDGRYVCVGDFNGDLRLMKYKIVNTDEDFTTRYVEGDSQNIIALDGKKKSTSDSPSFLAQVDSNSKPNSLISGLITTTTTSGNLTGEGLVDPRSEFDIIADEESVPVNFEGNNTKKSKSKNSKE